MAESSLSHTESSITMTSDSMRPCDDDEMVGGWLIFVEPQEDWCQNMRADEKGHECKKELRM